MAAILILSLSLLIANSHGQDGSPIAAAECTHGETFQTCGSACVATCDEPAPICIQVCRAGCACPKDKPIKHNGQCITMNECPPSCPGDLVYKTCSTPASCLGSCDDTGPRICPAVCGPPGCQCPSEAPIKQGNRCITQDLCDCKPLHNCGLDCEFGLDYNDLGCKICSCAEPCKDVFCLPGVPTPVMVNCLVAPCIPAYTCACQPCPQVRCSTRCPLGWVLDENECSTCQCRDPCQGNCGSKEVCDVQVVYCIRAPCPPLGICRERVCGDDLPLKEFLYDVTCDERSPCPDGFSCNEGLCCPDDRCFLPADSGPCLDFQTYYYYDYEEGVCRSFPYGGCGGNKNRFKNPFQCEQQCDKDSRCSDLDCDLECLVYKVDKKGCPVCECTGQPIDPCILTFCPQGTICLDGECISQSCGAVLCPPFCKFGCKREPLSGCLTITCNENDPCIARLCPEGSNCKNGECFPTNAECDLTDVLICNVFCEFGNVIAPDGCPTCQCKSGCEAVTCPVGVPCIRGECVDEPLCHPLCPRDLFCPGGFVKTGGTCFECRCFDPCQDFECNEGEACVIQPVFCKKEPCPPVPICVESTCFFGAPLFDGFQVRDCDSVEEGEEKCPAGYNCQDGQCCAGRTCDLPVDSGSGDEFVQRWYHSRKHGDCEPFLYSGTGGNENNFESQLSCRRQCICALPPCAPPPDFIEPCQYGMGMDDFGCYTCGCFDPCADVECSGGTVCYPLPARNSPDLTYVGQCFAPCPKPLVFTPEFGVPFFCCSEICGPFQPLCPCSIPGEPRCICPQDTPIYLNGECLSQDQCPEEPAQECPEGQQFSNDVICPLTCTSPLELCNQVKRQGCMCTDDTPILHDGECIRAVQCPNRCDFAEGPSETGACADVECKPGFACFIGLFGEAGCCSTTEHECPKGQIFVNDASCPQTCTSPLEFCVPTSAPGCACAPETPILLNGQCVTSSECPSRCELSTPGGPGISDACLTAKCSLGFECLVDLFGEAACCPVDRCVDAIEPEPGSNPCEVVDCSPYGSNPGCIFKGCPPERPNCKVDANNHAFCCADDVFNPCAPVGEPLGGYFCGRGFDSRECPDGFYCNIDPVDRFAVCCPDEVDCSAPADAGPCEGLFPRWFYNFDTGSCEQFQYGGCDGNSNRFSSQDACEGACGRICELPLKVGPCRQAINRWFYNSDSQQCEMFSWGGCEPNGNNFLSLQQCQANCIADVNVCAPLGHPVSGPDGDNVLCGGGESCPAGSRCVIAPDRSFSACCPVDCHLPVDQGPCYASIPSWYYDVDTGMCRAFNYGGCQGNSNRFTSVHACQTACSSGICSLPPESGFCQAAFLRWYYNPASGQCETFTWGGCGGNNNKFETQELCERNCERGRCELPADPGLCKGFFPKWFFNSESGKCEQFIYGGCGGNDNRFDSKLKCIVACKIRAKLRELLEALGVFEWMD